MVLAPKLDNKMTDEFKTGISTAAGIIVLALLVTFLIIGPAGIKTMLYGWKASAYGSDWLVVQYAQSGCVISSWELENEAVKNENGSDGILFVTPEGVVHLSGHYIYVQNPRSGMKSDLLSSGFCAE